MNITPQYFDLQGASAYTGNALSVRTLRRLITVDIYGHLEPGKNREAMAKLDDGFSTYEQKAGCTGGAQTVING